LPTFYADLRKIDNVTAGAFLNKNTSLFRLTLMKIM